MNVRLSESSSTRMTTPATTPDQHRGERVDQPLLVGEAQQPPGTAATLNSSLVGVTAGLGTCRTLSCNGNSSTAPDTPAGVVMRASTRAQSALAGHSQGITAA
jgi:hypothetical protein